MKKLFMEIPTLSLNSYDDAIEFTYDKDVYIIKNVSKTAEEFNPHISSFIGEVNAETCSFIVNCGLTPPIINFTFSKTELVLPINHSFQEEILEELDKLIDVPIN
jgi:hypothetical protein